MATKSNAKAAVPATGKAHTTGRWAEIMFRALSTRVAKRWQFVSFRGKKKGEWKGVVDLIAIRKSTAQPDLEPLKRGDLLDIILVQVKGGTSRPPTVDDRRRLQTVANHYGAQKVVLFSWKKEKECKFSVLQDDLSWSTVSGQEIFG